MGKNILGKAKKIFSSGKKERSEMQKAREKAKAESSKVKNVRKE